jgi:hypothetical protein
MNLVEIILKEHSKSQTKKIMKYVGNNPSRFTELVKVYLAGPYRVTQRAAWPLSYCVEHHPQLIKPHLGRIVKFLSVPGIHDSVKRNTMRLLQFISIPKTQQGKVADIAFQYLQDPKEPVSIKVFSMTVLANLCGEFPELKNELIPILESQLPLGSAGYRSRASKILKALKS